ncbi:hypothetical protein [Paenibacillus sp. N3.4]|uniref:hypothetical protein n=1 Tax=Paenibacillus sp. N3.4 TaxID=2603222 RepID=UPI001C9C76C5|nr:hypothetical protein [Paenibacillus sp. N3.4]
MLSLCTPLLASAASLFNFQFNSVTGEVYGYIYSDKKNLSVSVNDETYGTKSIASNLSSSDMYNSYYYTLNSGANNNLIGLKPVTMTVYEDNTPVYSTINQVTGNVYSYENEYKLNKPTGLTGAFLNGKWRVSWDIASQPLQFGYNLYVNDGSFYGVYYDVLKYFDLPYVIGGPTIDVKMKAFDVMGKESDASDVLHLSPSSDFDGYKYHGIFQLHGIPQKGTKFVVKDASGNVAHELTYNGNRIEGNTSVGHYQITNDLSGDGYFASYALAYSFDLPSDKYTITVTTVDNKSFNPKTYPNGGRAAIDVNNRKYYDLTQNGEYPVGSFASTPQFIFNNKEVGHWMQPNEEIARFTPSRGQGKFLSVSFPFDPYGVGELHAGNATTINMGILKAD